MQTSKNQPKTPKFSAVLLLARYARKLEQHAGLIVILSLLLAIVGGYYSVFLFKNLKTDIEELLPESAQSVLDLKKVLGKVAGLNHLSVVIQSQDIEAGRKFQADMARELNLLPKSLVARVQYDIKTERDFFEKNKSLYIDYEDWFRIHKYVRDRIHYEKTQKKKVFSLDLDDEKVSVAKPELDFAQLKAKYQQRAESASRFENGLFESRDHKTHVILAFLPGKVSDVTVNQKLSQIAHQLRDQLNPKKYASDMVVGFDGDVQNIVEEHHGLVEDLVKSFVIVTLLVTAVLILYLKSFAAVCLLTLSLFEGVAWTFGLSYGLVGYLNANTAFLGSIVIGNGINFGIIYVARYLEERRNGKTAQESLLRSVGFTIQATLTAALAAGLAYASLMITDFRGFNQFGIIGGLGMALCWLSSIVTLPALIVVFERLGLFKVKVTHSRPIIFRWVSAFVLRFHKAIAALTVVSVVLSLVGISRLSVDATLESDFTKLRNKESMTHGAGYWGKKVDEVFERYLTPTVVLVQNENDAAKVVVELEKIKAREKDSSPIADIKRIEDFLPKDQRYKLKLIDEINWLVPVNMRSKLSPDDRKIVNDILPKQKLVSLELQDLPEGLQAPFRESDGSLGNMIHIYPKLGSTADAAKPNAKPSGFWDGKEVIRFAEHIREAIKVAGVPAAIAGQSPLSADMISAIANDGPKATAFAFLAVFILVLVVFPKWHLARSVLGALLLGVLWMAALIGYFHLKINFLNFIALPITFGIGVDYAVNVFSRYRHDGESSISSVIENTGGAVALCSATTSIGYGSLLIAGSQAFVSFGMLAVLGEITCLTAALIAFPAFWHLFDKKKTLAPQRQSQLSL